MNVLMCDVARHSIFTVLLKPSEPAKFPGNSAHPSALFSSKETCQNLPGFILPSGGVVFAVKFTQPPSSDTQLMRDEMQCVNSESWFPESSNFGNPVHFDLGDLVHFF
ncbi:hypothetical protein EVAR_68326_1, partial [Eumeta japonica]